MSTSPVAVIFFLIFDTENFPVYENIKLIVLFSSYNLYFLLESLIWTVGNHIEV